MLIIDDKINNRKSLTSLNNKNFWFIFTYNMCYPSWNLIYRVWNSIIYSNLLIASLLKIIKQHVCFCTCESLGTFGSWDGNIKNNCKLSEVFHIFHRFTLRFSEREVKAPCFTQCCFSSTVYLNPKFWIENKH